MTSCGRETSPTAAVFHCICSPIIRRGRREEDEFWRAFRELQPRILGGLLDAVVGGLRELPSVKLAELPRMADFARFGEAVGRGLGWPAETFLSAYQENRKEATGSVIEDSALGRALLRCIASNRGYLNWTGSPTKFLEEITAGLEKKVAASAGWPKTVKMLGCEMRRLAPQLREHGVFVTFGKNRKSRLISITTRPFSDDDGYSSATP